MNLRGLTFEISGWGLKVRIVGGRGVMADEENTVNKARKENDKEDSEEQPRLDRIKEGSSERGVMKPLIFSHDLLLLDEDDEFESLEVPSLQDEDEGRSFIPIEKRMFPQVTVIIINCYCD